MQSPKDQMQNIVAQHFAQIRAAVAQPQSVFILYRKQISSASQYDSKVAIQAYTHRSTAEYEMHICIQGDDYDVATGKTWVNDYEYVIEELKLSRHKEF